MSRANQSGTLRLRASKRALYSMGAEPSLKSGWEERAKAKRGTREREG
jgi:hypothetical protein